MKKLKLYPKLVELAGALSELVFSSYNEDDRAMLTLKAAFDSLPQDIQARYNSVVWPSRSHKPKRALAILMN